MVGITSFGAYVPLFRLDRKVIGGRGEKAICSFDEDSVTMAVEAVSDCLKGRDRNSVEAIYFGTTSAPYREHSSATTIAMASDFREQTYTAEFGNCLRAGTAALKAGFDSVMAGSTRSAMVVASDCRLGHPGSMEEKNLGDGAAAILLGDKDAAVTLEGSFHVYNEIIDVWRSHHDRYVRSWESRFAVEQGYLPSMGKAIRGLMERYGFKPDDFDRVCLYSPDGRRGVKLSKSLGFDVEKQLQDPLIDSIGDTGAASVLMGLVAALEQSSKGELILCAGYGNGADAFVFKVNGNIEKARENSMGIGGHSGSRRVVDDYMRYLRWRGIIPIEKAAGPHAAYSAVAAKREYDRTVSLHGSRCLSCGYVQYPPQRVCTKCRERDCMEQYSFIGRKGRIFTYNLDYITPRAEIPVVTTEVDFEGGGRIQSYMTEADSENITVGMPVEMTFRRYSPWDEITDREGVCTYFWESKPVR